MKKILFLILLLFGSLFAESTTRIIGGINYANLYGDDDEENNSILGFKFGIEKDIPKGLVIGSSYTMRGYYWDDDFAFKMNYLTGYLLKSIETKSINLLIGAEMGYLLNGESEGEECSYDGGVWDCDKDTTEWDTDDWDDEGSVIDFGLLFGLKLPISETIFLNGTYYLGLANIWNASTEEEYDYVEKHKGLQLYLSFAL